MSTLNDGDIYDPNDKDQQLCLEKAKCYIDRTVNPPVIRLMKDDSDYLIIGWVRLTAYGEFHTYGVDAKPGDDGKYFEYNGKKFPPGVYYLIKKDGRKILISEKTLKYFEGLP